MTVTGFLLCWAVLLVLFLAILRFIPRNPDEGLGDCPPHIWDRDTRGLVCLKCGHRIT
jgi:hypothetical protein